jgi:hypothetical protein
MDSGNVGLTFRNEFSPLNKKPTYLSQNNNSEMSINDEINNKEMETNK